MAWAKSKALLEKVQLGSIVLYLVCLGGYTLPVVREVWDQLRADIFGFAFFSLFIASTILLRFEEDDAPAAAATDDDGAVPGGDAVSPETPS